MQLLKKLKLTRYQRNNSNNPILQRRIKLAAGITEQIQLIKNPNYKPVSVRTFADEDGGVCAVEVSKHVLRWWCMGADGTVELTVRYGSRVLGLAKELDCVELASVDELVPVLEQFKATAEHSEMYEMIAEQIANRMNKTAAKVAD